MKKKKYSVSVYLRVKRVDKNGREVGRWCRHQKIYFRTKKEAINCVKIFTQKWTEKATMKREY